MPVWFVYRSPYDGPVSKHVRRLEGPDTLLGWFRSVWRGIPDIEQAVRYADSLLGTHVYSFGGLFRNAAERGHAPPVVSDEELHARLESALYVQGFHAEADAIQVLSDDDELCMTMYWFTDAFAAADPQHVAWLLHDDWHLPDKAGPGGLRRSPAFAMSQFRDVARASCMSGIGPGRRPATWRTAARSAGSVGRGCPTLCRGCWGFPSRRRTPPTSPSSFRCASRSAMYWSPARGWRRRSEGRCSKTRTIRRRGQPTRTG